MNTTRLNEYRTSSKIHFIRDKWSDVVFSDRFDVDETFADIAESHYMRTTTRSQRFHQWRVRFVGDPLSGGLAFVVAVRRQH